MEFNIQMKVLHRNMVFLILLLSMSINSLKIHFRERENYKELTRFWTNVGFSPPAPLPLNNSQISEVLLSKDVQLNNEIVSSLPNNGVDHIRIHWLLSLIQFV